MAVLNSGLQTAWTPEDYGKLVDLVLAGEEHRVPRRHQAPPVRVDPVPDADRRSGCRVDG